MVVVADGRSCGFSSQIKADGEKRGRREQQVVDVCVDSLKAS